MTKTINPHDIIIGPRAREVGDISALVHSIESTGVLIHPPTVRRIATAARNTPDETVYVLVSGARRLAAVKELGWVEIPVTLIPNINDSTALLLELDENRRRENFKWQEEIILKCNVFFEMMKTQPQIKQVWFAEEILGESAGMFSIELELFKGKDEFPEIMEIESLTKAREHLRKLRLNELIKERQKRKQIVDEDYDPNGPESNNITDKEATQGSINIKSIMSPTYKIYPEAIEMLKSLPANSVDCCVTDPPFGIELQKVKNRSDGARVYGDKDDFITYENLIGPVLGELNRVLVPGAHLYMFFSMKNYTMLSVIAETRNFAFWPHPLIWIKYNFNGSGSPGSCQAADYLPAMTYHPILFCWSIKGARRTLVKRGEPNIIIHPPISPSVKDHPLSFPVEVYANLMARSCYPGDTIVDPFCGTGNSIKAGLINGFNMIGSERMERYRVLAEEKAQGTIKELEEDCYFS